MYTLILIIAMNAHAPFNSAPVSVHTNSIEFKTEEACLNALNNVKLSVLDRRVVVYGSCNYAGNINVK